MAGSAAGKLGNIISRLTVTKLTRLETSYKEVLSDTAACLDVDTDNRCSIAAA